MTLCSNITQKDKFVCITHLQAQVFPPVLFFWLLGQASTLESTLTRRWVISRQHLAHLLGVMQNCRRMDFHARHDVHAVIEAI